MSVDIIGAGALLLASLLWAAGSLYSRTAKLPDSSDGHSAGVAGGRRGMHAGRQPGRRVALNSARSADAHCSVCST